MSGLAAESVSRYCDIASSSISFLLVQKLDSTSPKIGLGLSGCVWLRISMELAVQKMNC